jgi:hypothetical protein
MRTGEYGHSARSGQFVHDRYCKGLNAECQVRL